MTYLELLQQIRDYTEVDSSVLTNSICDTFIKNSEYKIFRQTDADYSREYATSSFTSGNKYLLLPNDSTDEGSTTVRRALIIRSVVVTNTSNVQVTLEPRDDTFITEYNADGSSGFPKYYAMFRESAIVVAPTPTAAYSVTLDYVYTPDNLSSTNTTTYISENAPELLLYACLVEAFAYLKGPADMYKLYSDKYNEALQGFALEQTGRRRRDEYEDGSMRIKIPSPSP
jgi:hypothetical protein